EPRSIYAITNPRTTRRGAPIRSTRPHDASDLETPAVCYTPSLRTMSQKIPSLEYPDRFEVHFVSANGGIRGQHDSRPFAPAICQTKSVTVRRAPHPLATA